MSDEERDELWQEIRILQLQLACMRGIIISMEKRLQRVDGAKNPLSARQLSALMGRDMAAEMAEADREAVEKDVG